MSRGERRSVSQETLAAQGLGETDPLSGGLAPVISLSTNYEQQPDGSYPQGRAYTRADNPTSEHAERLLAALEGGGCACALFASGMAAATAVFQALLPGDHVLVSRVLYWDPRGRRLPQFTNGHERHAPGHAGQPRGQRVTELALDRPRRHIRVKDRVAHRLGQARSA
jgi:hypothetical protein